MWNIDTAFRRQLDITSENVSAFQPEMIPYFSTSMLPNVNEMRRTSTSSAVADRASKRARTSSMPCAMVNSEIIEMESQEHTGSVSMIIFFPMVNVVDLQMLEDDGSGSLSLSVVIGLRGFVWL